MLGRFFICIASNAVFQFSVEIMPTVIRGQASAIANAMGTLFTIASPYIAHSVSHSWNTVMTTKVIRTDQLEVGTPKLYIVHSWHNMYRAT